MTWQTELKQASFRGIPFFVQSGDMPFGRRKVSHEYPFRDTNFSEDIGKKARAFSINAYVMGDDYLDQMDRLVSAIEDNKEAGTLILPTMGSMLVNPGPCRRMFDNQTGGLEYLELNFEQAGQRIYPEAGLTSASKVKQTAQSTREALVAVFSGAFNARSKVQYIPDDAAMVNTSFIETVQGLLQGATPTSLGMGNITAALQPLIANGPEYLQTAATWAGQVQGVITSIRDGFANPHQAYNVNRGLIGFGGGFTPVVQLTSNRVTQKTNRDAQTSLVRSQALTAMAESASDIAFPSYNDAVAVRDRLAAAIEAEILTLGDTDYDNAIIALDAIRADMVSDITARSATLRRVKTIQRNETMPAVVLAYELFGNTEQEADIIARNKIIRPNSVPAGRPIEVLA